MYTKKFAYVISALEVPQSSCSNLGRTILESWWWIRQECLSRLLNNWNVKTSGSKILPLKSWYSCSKGTRRVERSLLCGSNSRKRLRDCSGESVTDIRSLVEFGWNSSRGMRWFWARATRRGNTTKHYYSPFATVPGRPVLKRTLAIGGRPVFSEVVWSNCTRVFRVWKFRFKVIQISFCQAFVRFDTYPNHFAMSTSFWQLLGSKPLAPSSECKAQWVF